ncbi:MAG TPA: peptidase S8, partial [Coleofasciculaceae cyanobacterium]
MADANPLPLDQSLPPDQAHGAIEMPASSLGLMLQRGGDEVLLEKVSDRFIVRPKTDRPLDPARLPGVTAVNPLGPGMALIEVQVAPEALDRTMQAAREAQAFDYVSHVYQYAGQSATRVYLGDEITIVFHPDLLATAIDAISQGLGLIFVKPIAGIANAYVYRLSDRTPLNPLKITNLLVANTAVLSAEPNAIIRSQAFYKPRDGFYSSQWYLQNSGTNGFAAGSHIDIEKAWDITRGDRAIVLAIADDGVDINHPDFKGDGKIVAPKDF